MNKAEFNKRYGHRYSHCENVEQHEGHPWSYRPDNPLLIEENTPHPWWCTGEEIDLSLGSEDPEGDTGKLLDRFRKAEEFGIQNISELKLTQEPVPQNVLSTEAVETLREKINRPELCPTCESRDPAQHPATQPDGGEVNLCHDKWHDVDPRTRELRKNRVPYFDPAGYDQCGDCGERHPGSGRDCWRYNPETADGTKPGEAQAELLREKLDVGAAVTSELVKWADRAMFQAEPIDTAAGPKVYLLWMTPDPLGAIAAACKMYKGEVVRDLSAVTDEERLEYLEQVSKTKLKAPFEFVKFHFLIEGVTRAFTHQMVRQRTAVYAQESLRFAVKGDENTRIPVGLPPSIAGTESLPMGLWDTNPRTNAQRMLQRWEETLDVIDEAYGDLIDLGMPAEDARGLLPHNTLTRLHYSTDLRALLDHAGNRLCTQAQFEWRLVFAKIAEAIRNASHDGRESNGENRVYFANHLADLFKPVCYQTGRCEFKANFDRACSIRNRVDASEEIGRPSSKWGEEYEEDGIEGIVAGCGPKSVVRDQQNRPVFIGAIKPGEWLLDPGAAREKS